MSTMIDNHKKELELAGLFNKDSDYGGMLGNAVLELCQTLEKQRHSGASVMMTVNIFNQLIKENILSPLTGKEDEWVEVAKEQGKPLYQNKRRSSVFKVGNEPAYDIDGGPIFKDINGCTYTNNHSVLRNIEFPYTPPKREIVDDYVLKQKERTKAAQQYISEHIITTDNTEDLFKWELVKQELWMWSTIATWEGTITKEDFDNIIKIRGFEQMHIDYIKNALEYMEIKIK